MCTLIRLARDPHRNKDPFGVCNEITFCLEDCEKFFRNYLSKQYETYALGAVVNYLEEIGESLVKNIVIGMGNKIRSELEPACQSCLPKFKQENDQSRLTEQIREFINTIPNLRYCPGQAEKYLVTSLDVIIKSVKEVNSRIESRLECYAWNI